MQQKKQLYKSHNAKPASSEHASKQKLATSTHLRDSDKVIQPKLKSVIQNFNLSINRFDPKEMLINEHSYGNLASAEHIGSKGQHSPRASNLEQSTAFSNTEVFRSGGLRIKSANLGSKRSNRLHYSNQLLHDAINSAAREDRGTRGLFSAAEPKRMRAPSFARSQGAADPVDVAKNSKTKSTSNLHAAKSQADAFQSRMTNRANSSQASKLQPAPTS
jgi:hypothetical protein